MPTVVELKGTVGLDDREFQAAVRRLSKSLGDISRYAQDTNRSLQSIRGGSDGIMDAAKAAREAESRFRDLRQSAQDLRNAGLSITVGLTIPIVQFGKSVLDSAVRMDSLKRAMDSVTGSGAETEVQLRRLREISQLPGLTFEQAIKGSIRLQNTGLSAQFAERTISAMGNALARTGGSSEDLEGVIRAITQIQSKGKVTAEELLQLAERLPSVFKIIKETFGTGDVDAIRKMGLTTEEFLEKIVSAFEKMPKVVGGIKNDMEVAADAIDQAYAKIATAALPTVSRFLQDFAPRVEAMARRFEALPKPVQEFAFATLGMTAAIGPALFIIGGMADAVVKLTGAWRVAVGLIPRILDFFKAQTVEAGVNTAATKAASVARDDFTRAVTINNAAVGTNTGTVGANTAALGANAAATRLTGSAAVDASLGAAAARGRMAGHARALGIDAAAAAAPAAVAARGVLGTGLTPLGFGLAALGTGAAVYGIGSAYTSGYLAPKSEEIVGDAWARSLREQSLAGRESIKTNRNTELLQRPGIQAAVRRLMAGGMSRAEAERQVLRARSGNVAADESRIGADYRSSPEFASRVQEDQKDIIRAREALFGARVQKVRSEIAGLEGERQIEKEAELLVPVLREKITEVRNSLQKLKSDGIDTAKERAQYYKEQQEYYELETQITALQARASKSRQDRAKRQRQLNRDIRDSILGTRVQRAEAMAGRAGEGFEYTAAAALVNPELERQKQAIAAEARSLVPELGRSEESTRRYAELMRDFWQIAERQEEIKRSAIKEQRVNADRVRKRAEEVRRETIMTEGVRIEALIAKVEEDKQAQAEVELRIPFLRKLQQDAVNRIKSVKQGSEEYQELSREYWRAERDIAEINAKAAKEKEDSQKRALDATRKQSEERGQLMENRLKLRELELRGNPFIGDRERGALLLPSMLRSYRELRQGGFAGETELEKSERAIEAQQLRNKIMEMGGLGSGAFARTARGGLLPLFDPRIAGAAMSGLAAIEGGGGLGGRNRALSAARGAMGNRTVVMQIVVDQVRNRQQLNAEYRRFLEEMADILGLSPRRP